MDVDNIFEEFNRLSSFELLKIKYNDKVAQINNVEEEKCGNCEHWMKSSCLPEKEHKQFKSASSYPCKDFEISSSSKQLLHDFQEELKDIKKVLIELRKKE